MFDKTEYPFHFLKKGSMKVKMFFITMVLCAMSQFLIAQEIPVIRLTTQWGTEGHDYASEIAIDSFGNIYVLGDTSGAFDGNTTLGQNDFFLTKFDNNGNKLWTKQWGTADVDSASGIAIDSFGNIYVTGTFGVFDDNTYTRDDDAFLTKFDNNGNKLWTKQWGNIASSENADGIAIDSSENIYVSGYTDGSLDGNTNLGDDDAFLTKFDNNGNKLWTKQWGTEGDDGAYKIAISSSGNIYVNSNILNGRYTSIGAFLTKFDNNGNKLWTKELGIVDLDFAYRIAISSSENIYVTGMTCDALDGNTNLGDRDAFLMKFDNNGNKLWTKQWGTTVIDIAYAIAIDSSENIYVTGSTFGALDGNTNLGINDFFLTKFDNNGNKLWTKQWGTEGYDYAYGIILNNSGNIYVAGNTSSALDGNTNSGVSDAFLTKISINKAPSLIAEEVNPKEGNTSTAFTFKVKYSDADNDAPADGYPRLHIKKGGAEISGSPCQMLTKDTNLYSEGRIYTSTITLSIGNDYSYWFEAYDVWSSSAATAFVDGPQVSTFTATNSAPVLDAEKVSPEKGNTSTAFTFKVKYSDTDNDAPADGYPRLHIKKSGSEISGSPYQMLTKDTNQYSEGRIYTSTITLPGGNDYSYWFEAYDVWSSSAATAFVDGPQVSTFTVTNSAPVLEAGKVSPEKGNTSTVFTFKVKYSDADNNAPKGGYPRLHIKERGTEIFGSPFEMKSEDTGLYIEGRMYTLNTRLPAGREYAYYFEAYDIHGTTAIGSPVNEKAGPEVLNKKNKAPILIFMNQPKNILRAPNTVNQLGEYSFSIKYRDEDEDAPLSGYPRLHIKKGEIEIEGSPFVMAEADKNKYSEGREYNCKPVLKAGANYTYYFEAYDINNTTAEGFISNSSFAVVLNTLENAYCYPSPAHLSKGDVIKFSGFSPDTKINILSSSGHILKKMSADIYGSIAPWDGKTEEGELLSTGVYIVHAADSQGNKKMFNLFIVN